MKEPIYLLDGYSIVYRSYFAFIKKPLRNQDGKNISALYGFFNTLLGMMRSRNSERIVVLMDSKTKTFRHEMYKEYKANRDKTPDELRDQIPLIEEALELLGVETLRVDGYEADDLMGTLAVKAKAEGLPAYIISGDKDLLQFCDDGIGILKPDKGQLIEMDRQAVFEDRGVWPEQIIDYLSLVGDAADNIPGVAGIGPKTAAKLLGEFQTLDGIYENIEQIKAKGQKQKLIDNKDDAFFSRELVVIKTDCPVEIPQKDLSLTQENKCKAAAFFMQHGLKNLANTLDSNVASIEEPQRPKAEKGTYEAILSEEGLNSWIEAIQKKGMVALDCETDNLDDMKAKPVGICLSTGGEKACYIPLKAPETTCLSEDLVRSKLKALLENPKLKVIGQNIKYDWKVLRNWGIDLGEIYFDTMIAAWMIDAGSPVNMDFLADRYLGYECIHFKDIVPKGSTFDQVPLDVASDYAAEDADITWRLYELLAPKLKEMNLEALYYEMEMPLLRILATMEFRGVLLSEVDLELFGRELGDALDLLKKEIYTLCGKSFNINSPKQLQEVLFTDRKLTPLKKTKSGYSTDTSVLKQLAAEDPVPEKILVYRGLNKLKSTYVEPLPLLIQPQTGRIHTHYVQTGTATGRLSSKDPNLQNIPVKDDNGRRIRAAFHPQKGSHFLSADYSQIELVVLAHLSEDEALRDAFNTGVDVHSKTASLIFKVAVEDVTAHQRRIAKTINFGVMYGMSAFRLSNELKIPRAEAAQFIETYFEEYKGIKKFVDDTVILAEKEGGVHTMEGRFRPIPEITSKNNMERNGAIRAAVNSRIQGTAADIVKRAMLGIDKLLAESTLKSQVLLQVHDEIILEVPETELEEAEALLRKAMHEAASLKVPLNVSVEQGKSWGDIH